MLPQEITAAEFKAKCLSLMDTVENNRTQIVITKRGRPVAKLVPYKEELPSVFGFMSGTGHINGNIIKPIDISWNAVNE